MDRSRAIGRDRVLDIAVIGAGVAGLAAAWLLARRHRVTLYEKEVRPGGHSHTVEAPGQDGPVPVDVGFIVYNEVNYPNLTALFAHLGVATEASDMSFAVSLDAGGVEYAGTSLATLLAQKRNLLRPRFWRMAADVLRFYRQAPRLLAGRERPTLGAYLEAEGYSAAFVEDHLLPMGAAIWSCPPATMLACPATSFVRFCDNHGLLRLRDRPQWRTVTGGSRRYVARLLAGIGPGIRLGTAAVALRGDAAGVAVTDAGGERRFDRAVVATHADQALALLADATRSERRILGAFRYQPNDGVLHGDAGLMPRRRAVWSSWNYVAGRGASVEAPVSVTYWMNRLQNLDGRAPLFLSLNPAREPQAGTVFGRFRYEHPIHDAAATSAQALLGTIQGARGIWFAGSYCGYGFHEDALTAGLAAAEAVGGVSPPWRVPELAA